MGLSLSELEHELARYAAVYRLSRHKHAVFAPYAEVKDLGRALAVEDRSAERLALVAALLEAQRSSPHRLWQTLLILAFAPVLKQLRARAHSEFEEDLDQQIVLAFLEAVARVGATGLDRASMYLRQTTTRNLFRALRAEKRTARLEREVPDFTCGRPLGMPPARSAVHDLLTDDERSAHDLLRTSGEHGQLRAYVRARVPSGSCPEFERVYRRLQQRRRRLVLNLRRARANRAA